MRVALACALAILGLPALAVAAEAESPAAQVLAETRNHLAFPVADQVIRGDANFAFATLSIWGAGSTLAGTTLMFRHRPISAGNFLDPASKQLFFEGLQHLGWGGADLALGIAGLARSSSMMGRLKPPTNRTMARIFWVNAALDLLYLSFAALALALSERPGSDREFWRGTGRSIGVQAGFLLVFDVASALRFEANSRRSRLRVDPSAP